MANRVTAEQWNQTRQASQVAMINKFFGDASASTKGIGDLLNENNSKSKLKKLQSKRDEVNDLLQRAETARSYFKNQGNDKMVETVDNTTKFLKTINKNINAALPQKIDISNTTTDYLDPKKNLIDMESKKQHHEQNVYDENKNLSFEELTKKQVENNINMNDKNRQSLSRDNQLIEDIKRSKATDEDYKKAVEDSKQRLKDIKTDKLKADTNILDKAVSFFTGSDSKKDVINRESEAYDKIINDYSDYAKYGKKSTEQWNKEVEGMDYAQKSKYIEELKENKPQKALENQIGTYKSGKEYLNSLGDGEKATAQGFFDYLEDNNKSIYSELNKNPKEEKNKLYGMEKEVDAWNNDKENRDKKVKYLSEYAKQSANGYEDYKNIADEYQKKIDESTSVAEADKLKHEFATNYEDAYLRSKQENNFNELSKEEQQEMIDTFRKQSDKSISQTVNAYDNDSIEQAQNTARDLNLTYARDKREELLKRGYTDREIDSMFAYAQAKVNQENAEKEYQENYEKGKETGKIGPGIPGKVLGAVATAVESVPGSLASGLGAASTIWSKLKQGFGSETPIDYNSSTMRIGKNATAMREGAKSNYNEIGKFVYDAFASTVDSAATIPLSKIVPGATTVLLGSSAASSAMLDAHDKGVSDANAIATGIGAGIFEGLFEKLSLDKLVDISKGMTKKGLKNAIKGVAQSSMIEGSEEGFTEIANILWDNAVNGDLSDYNIALKQYMDQGMTKSEAKQQTDKDMAKRIALNVGGGMLGGLFFSLPAAGYSRIQNKGNIDITDRGEKIIKNNMNTELKEYIEDNYDNNSDVYKLMENTDFTNAGEVGYLSNAVELNEYENAMQKFDDAMIPAVKSRLEELNVPESDATDLAIKTVKNIGQKNDIDAGQYNEAYKQVKSEIETKNNGASVEWIDNIDLTNQAEHINNIKKIEGLSEGKSLKTEKEKKIKTQQDKLENNVNDSVEEKINNGTVVENGKASLISDENAKFNILSLSVGTDGRTKVNTDTRQTYDIDDVIVDRKTAELNEFANEYEGEDRQKFFRSYDENNNLSPAKFAMYYNEAYRYGSENLGIESALKNSRLTNVLNVDAIARAYDSGKAEYWQKIEQREVNTEKNKQGKVTFDNVVPKMLNETQEAAVNVAKVLSKVTGVDYEFFESKKDSNGKYQGENGSYDRKENKIRIDINAGMISSTEGNNVMVVTLAHELTHYAENLAPAEYANLQEFVFNKLSKESGKSIEQLIADEIKNNGGKISEDVAKSELVARGCEAMLTDSENIKALARQDAGLFAKIKTKIDQFCNKIIKACKEILNPDGSIKDSAISKEAQMLQNYAEELRSLWSEAVKSAGESNYTVYNGNTKTDEVRMLRTDEFYENVTPCTREDALKLKMIDIKNVARYRNEIDGVFTGKLDKEKKILLGMPSRSLIEKGLENKPITMSQNVARKIAYPMNYKIGDKNMLGKDNLGMSVLKNLIYQINDPMAITKNTNNQEKNNEGIVIWTNWKNENNESIIAAIRIDKNGEIKVGNTVVTVFNASSDYAKQFINDKTKVLYTKNNKDINSLLTARRHMPSAKTDDVFIKHNVAHNKKDVKQNNKNDNEILYSYGGRKSAEANLEELENAKKMEKEGKSFEEIFKETGWFRGIDNRWKYEIDDSKMTFDRRGHLSLKDNQDYRRYKELSEKIFGNSDFSQNEWEEYGQLEKTLSVLAKFRSGGNTVGDYVKHDEMFKQYPFLKDVKLKFIDMENKKSGRYDGLKNTIFLNKELKNNVDEVKRTMLHELQHAIQKHEEFAGGANVEYWKGEKGREDVNVYDRNASYINAQKKINEITQNAPKEFVEKYREINRSMLKAQESKKESDWNEHIKLENSMYDNPKYGQLYQELIDARWELVSAVENVKEMTPEDMYKNTAGEIEARDVSKRINYTAEQRKSIMPDRGNNKTLFSSSNDYKYSEETLKQNRTDSEGNKLTKEQQEYFKDSKVRDEDGNLRIVYHGTDVTFNVFDRTKTRSNMDIQGSFFSPWEIDAGGYGNNTRAYYLNIKNPASEAMGYKALNKFKGQENAGIKAREYLESLGYDGVNNGDEEYIIFNSNQAKLVANETPTSSEDIRYQDREANKNTYSYDELVKKDDLVITKERRNYRNLDASTCINRIISDLKEEKNSIVHNGNVAIKNNDTGDYILVTKGALRHGITSDRTGATKLVSANIAEAIRNGIRVNVAVGTRNNADSAYILMGKMEANSSASKGTYYYRMVVNRYESNNRNMYYIDDLYSIKVQKKKTSAARIATSVTAKADGFPDPLKVKVSDFLNEVKDYYGESLSEDVNNHVGRERGKSDIEGLLYQDRNTDSSREILATALESTIKNDTERQYIKNYRDNIDKLYDLDKKLDIVNGALKEMYFAPGNKPTSTIKDLQQQANGIRKQMKRYENNLLKLESTKTLKNFVERENKAAAVKQRQVDAERLREYRTKQNERFDRMQKRYQEAAKQKVENRKRIEARNKVIKRVDKLNKWLEKPNNRKYVPAKFMNSTVHLLDGLNQDVMNVAQRLDDVRAEMAGYTEVPQNLVNRYTILLEKNAQLEKRTEALSGFYKAIETDPDYAGNYSQTVMDQIDKMKETVKDKPIGAMNVQELNVVKDTIDLLTNEITKWNETLDTKFIDGEENEMNIKEISDKAYKELVQRPKVKDNMVQTFLNSQLSPTRFFKRIGGYAKNGVWEQLGEMLNDGQRAKLRYEQGAATIFDKVTSNRTDKSNQKNLARLKKETVDIGLVDEDGKPVEITKGMMLSVYKHLLNEENLRHAMYGGFTIPELKDYYKGDRSKAYAQNKTRALGVSAELAQLGKDIQKAYDQGATDSEVAKIESGHKEIIERGKMQMAKIKNTIEGIIKEDEYLKKWVDCSSEYFEKYSKDAINEVTMKRYSMKKAGVDNYYPIHTDSNYLAKEKTEKGSKAANLENSGFMQDRVKSTKPIYLEDITNVVNDSISGTGTYVGYLIPQYNYNRILGYTTDGFKTNIKNALEKRLGEQATGYLSNLEKDLFGGRNGESTSKFMSKMRGKVAQGALTLNIPVTFGQAASYFTAAPTVGWKNLAKAFAKGGKNNFVLSAADRELINKYSPLLWYRNLGNVSQDIHDSKNADGIYNKINDKTNGYLFGWIQKADVATVGRLWYAAQYYVNDNFKELKKGSDEYYEQTAKVFNKIVEETQPNYTVMQRPAVLRSKNEIVKSFTMFSTQRMQNYNILFDSLSTAKKYSQDFKKGINGVTAEDVKQANRTARRAVTSQIVSAAVLGAMKTAAALMLLQWKNFGDDEDKFSRKNVLKYGLDQFMSNISGTIVGGTDLYSFVSSIINDDVYYGISLTGFDAITDFVEEIEDYAAKVKNGKLSTKDNGKLIKNFSTFMGIPYAQAKKIYEGVTGWTQYTASKIEGENKELTDFAQTNEITTINKVRKIIKQKDFDTKAFEEIMQEQRDNIKSSHPEYKKSEVDKKAKASLRSRFTTELKQKYKSKEMSKSEVIEQMKRTELYTDKSNPYKTLKNWDKE